MHYFCPYCWHEHHPDALLCPTCHHSLTTRLPYRRALELALSCPEALTARRAAYLLGVLSEIEAVPALTGALESPDPYLAAEAVLALARIGGSDAWRAVGRARQHRFVVARRAAMRAFRDAPTFVQSLDSLAHLCAASGTGGRLS